MIPQLHNDWRRAIVVIMDKVAKKGHGWRRGANNGRSFFTTEVGMMMDMLTHVTDGRDKKCENLFF